eukprot:3317481-Karenia_brevis.AAC.1
MIGIIEQDGDVHGELARAKEAASKAHEEDDEAYDDVSGVKLNPRLVRRAREAEMDYFRKMNVYKKVDIG